MSGPTDAAAALAWIQEAMNKSLYRTHPHLDRRMRERNVYMREIRHAIAHPISCLPYVRESFEDGTNWRIVGHDLHGGKLGVGIEAFKDHLGRRALLITIFDV